MTYTTFDDLCGKIESRFKGVRKLPLRSSLDLSSVLVNGPVLDFGCGKGGPLGRGPKIVTFDPDPEVNAQYKTLEDLSSFYTRPDGGLHGIMANQVFEHIPRDMIAETLEKLSACMNSGASMIVTLPNVCNWFKYIGDIDHKTPLAFFHMGAYMEMAGLDVVDAYYCTKRYAEIREGTVEEQAILSVLSKYFEMTPAHFVAVRGVKK